MAAKADLLVLAAGFGRRLRPLTDTIPKPLIEVGGRPVVDWALGAFASLPEIGRRACVIAGAHREFFRPWADAAGVELVANAAGSPEEARGAVSDMALAVRELGLGRQGLFVVGGDNLFSEVQRPFVAECLRRPSRPVIATYETGDLNEVRRFAEVRSDPAGRVSSIIEKPESPEVTTAGIMLYYLPATAVAMLGTYLEDAANHPDNAGFFMEYLFREPGGINAVPIVGEWFDIGDHAALTDARDWVSASD